MERKIGEVFEYEDKKLQVKEISIGCDGCFFDRQCNNYSKEKVGGCSEYSRSDHKNVIFMEVKEEHVEQPQEQVEQPQELNLFGILKNCPEGKPFWSPLLEDVRLYNIDEEEKKIVVIAENGVTWGINADATITINGVKSPEIMLYPSREQRDWTKVKYEPKKERFDPKTLKPFDSVLVYGEYEGWFCTIFSHIGVGEYPYNTASGNYGWCIPYNDETKHLVGTKDEAPDFYRYWEE